MIQTLTSVNIYSRTYRLNININFKQGNPRLSSSALMTVILLDVNDNAPEFERTVYAVSVNEAVNVGSNVSHVNAMSRDTGVNAEITYSIIGSVVDVFVINSISGRIEVSHVVIYILGKVIYIYSDVYMLYF